MTKRQAQRRALAAFTRRYGPSSMPLELRNGNSSRDGDLICVFDPEDRMHVGYAYENRSRLVQVLGPRERQSPSS